MSGSEINIHIVQGTLGGAPIVRSLPDGDQVANLSVATHERWKVKDSEEWKERTHWHEVVVWNQHLIENVIPKLGKGDLVRVQGASLKRQYEDKDGVKREVTEIKVDRFNGEVGLVIDRNAMPADNALPADAPTPDDPLGGDEIPH